MDGVDLHMMTGKWLYSAPLAKLSNIVIYSHLLLHAKRTRRQFERRWKRTGAESDRMAYRSACRVANAEIDASRSVSE